MSSDNTRESLSTQRPAVHCLLFPVFCRLLNVTWLHDQHTLWQRWVGGAFHETSWELTERDPQFQMPLDQFKEHIFSYYSFKSESLWGPFCALGTVQDAGDVGVAERAPPLCFSLLQLVSTNHLFLLPFQRLWPLPLQVSSTFSHFFLT